jgi:hypothetical protein
VRKLVATALRLLLLLAILAGATQFQGKLIKSSTNPNETRLDFAQGRGDLQEAMGQAEAWMNPIVTREEVKAMQWVRENTPPKCTLVSDIFGSEIIMGSTLRYGTEGGDWSIIPNVIERMGDIDKFYKESDSGAAHAIAVKYNASYAVMPNRNVFAGFDWKYPTQELKEPFFTLAYEDNGFRIYKVDKA